MTSTVQDTDSRKWLSRSDECSGVEASPNHALKLAILASTALVAVSTGRRTPEQSAPVMPPRVARCRRRVPDAEGLAHATPTSRADLAGARDRALLLVGFVVALRRSELAAVGGQEHAAAARPLYPDPINALVQQAVARAGIDPAPYRAHNLRAGFVTYASDRAIAHHTGIGCSSLSASM